MVNSHTIAVMSLELQIPGILGCISTAFIILTFAIFKDLKNFRFISLVFYSAINDFLGSLGVSLEYQPLGSFGCLFQGLVTNANFVSSSFWTVVITYQMWLAVMKGQIIPVMTCIHCICWGFPWFVALLPLISSTYGLEDDEYDFWCFVESTSHSPSWSLVFWFWFSCYASILSSIMVMVVLLFDVARTVRWERSNASDLVTSAVNKLAYYLLIIFVCWIPSPVSDFLISGDSENAHDAFMINSIGNIFPACQGFLSGIVFIVQNERVRQQWLRFLGLNTPEQRPDLAFGVNPDSEIDRDSDYIPSASIGGGSTGSSGFTDYSSNPIGSQKKGPGLRTLDQFMDI